MYQKDWTSTEVIIMTARYWTSILIVEIVEIGFKKEDKENTESKRILKLVYHGLKIPYSLYSVDSRKMDAKNNAYRSVGAWNL